MLKWRLPLTKGNRKPVQSANFLAAVTSAPHSNVPRCVATARMTGKRCRKEAMRGATTCNMHNGHKAAAKAFEERTGKKAILTGGSKRKAALVALGLGPWPIGLEARKDLLELGPLARGKLFEAHANRLTSPEYFKHEMRVRKARALNT